MALEEGEDINEVADGNRKFQPVVGTPIPKASEVKRGRGRGRRGRPRLDDGAPNRNRKNDEEEERDSVSL